MRIYSNQGPNHSLHVWLSGNAPYWVMEILLPVRFEFLLEPPGSPRGSPSWEDMEPWTEPQQAEWILTFARIVRAAWSRKWPLEGRPRQSGCSGCGSCSSTYPRVRTDVTVRVQNMNYLQPDPEGPIRGRAISQRQRTFLVQVFRRAPDGSSRGRQHAAPTSREAQLYEDAIDPEVFSPENHRQVVAAHEAGHLLGLGHSNQTDADCLYNREPVCYGRPFSRESAGIMGRGMAVLKEDYTIFARMMRRFERDYEWEVGEYQGRQANSFSNRRSARGVLANSVRSGRLPRPTGHA
ncbi:MAG: matrixin family metalloprotease [Acidobacteria bacterium]|nr:matrixin family metalloprotease [Acidobacteriota bacterium]